MASEDSTAGLTGRRPLPEIDFSTLVLSLSTSALYQMGLVQGPAGELIEDSEPLLAQQTIETLKMLRVKTAGNLEPDESKLLDSLLYDLHSQFAQLQK